MQKGKTVADTVVIALVVSGLTVVAKAQNFDSGSTGADGDLIVNTPGVTVFSQTPQGGGNIYNFKTIQIASGSTLQLSGATFPNPLYFLAKGAVTVAGTIDLSGQSGSATPPTTPAQRGGPTIPGAGGYGGGAPRFGSNPAQPGLGPAGGVTGCRGSGYGTGGGFTGNQFLVPLVGGSGGGGADTSGGAGGGALLIASSVSITVTGTITANGGNSGGYINGGAGAGGAIRLVAPSIAGTGALTSAGGSDPCMGGGAGIIRLEAFQITFTGSHGGTLYTATPVGLFLPPAAGQPTIMVTSIAGVPVPPNPTGSFTVPDVTINSSSPVTVQIQATNIPVGTKATLYFLTENFPDQAIVSNPLAGTLASSTATATVTLQPGYSKGYVVATWTQ